MTRTIVQLSSRLREPALKIFDNLSVYGKREVALVIDSITDIAPNVLIEWAEGTRVPSAGIIKRLYSALEQIQKNPENYNLIKQKENKSPAQENLATTVNLNTKPNKVLTRGYKKVSLNPKSNLRFQNKEELEAFLKAKGLIE